VGASLEVGLILRGMNGHSNEGCGSATFFLFSILSKTLDVLPWLRRYRMYHYQIFKPANIVAILAYAFFALRI
jgi:hypothetical protein